MATYGLYVIAGLCWLKVVDLQYRIRKLAKLAHDKQQPLSRDDDHAVRLWFWLGWPAIISLIVVFALMAMKPGP